MRIAVGIMTDRDTLVKAAQRHMIDAIMTPAYKALSQDEAGRVRVRVNRLVEAGQAVAADALVQDTVRLDALEREIRRHIAECATCVALPGLSCIELGRLDSRANRLLTLVANAGGMR